MLQRILCSAPQNQTYHNQQRFTGSDSLAHEIAHSVLHTNITAAFHEFTLFDDTDRQEYEANLFAAELLLSDDCVLNALNEDQFFFQAAKALYVPAELLDFKFRVMKRKGYKLESPIVSHGNFLKTIE